MSHTKIPFEVLEFENVRVLPFNLTHLTDTYVSWLNNEEIVKYSEQRHYKHTLESCRAYYYQQQQSIHLFLAIEYLDQFWIHVGNMGVSFDIPNQRGDISIMIGNKSYCGKGIATKAWQLVMDYLLEHKHVFMVTAGTMELNTSMIKLMQRTQMQIDGILPNRFLFDGKRVGMVCASKTINPL